MPELELFLEEVTESLQRWYDVHNDAEAWAEMWLCDEPPAVGDSPVISNDFFSFDWRSACIRRLAADWIGYFSQCPECRYISEDVDCDCEAEPEPLEDVEELVEWMGQWEPTIPDHIAMEALEQDGFPVYRQALAYIVDDISEEVQQALDRIWATPDGADKLSAIHAALSIMHHSGCIAQDYGGDWDLVEIIRQDGFADTFGADEVRDYIS